MSDLLKIKLAYKQDRMPFSEQQKAMNAPTAPRVSTSSEHSRVGTFQSFLSN